MTPPEKDRFYRLVRGSLAYGDNLRAFADRAQISRSTIYSWFDPKRGNDPEWESLRRVAAELDMPMWRLVQEIEEEPSRISTLRTRGRIAG